MNQLDDVGVNPARLTAWMDERGLGDDPIEKAALLTGGTQNILVRFARGQDQFVLRRPPLHKRPNSDETMEREARVLAAIASSDVPHPRLLAACDDPAVIGASFYLMEPVDGFNPTVSLPELHRADESVRHHMGLAMADAAAALSRIDYVGIGLADLAHPGNAIERQVARSQRQLSSYTAVQGYDGTDLTELGRVHRWLDANQPPRSGMALVHGDFHLANSMFAYDGPRLLAVVDWELSSVGDPLMDIAWLLATWPGDDTPVAASVGARPWRGFPTRTEIIARYASGVDHPLDALPWFEVLACYKLAAILEGTHVRAIEGKAKAANGDRLHAAACGLTQKASNLIKNF